MAVNHKLPIIRTLKAFIGSDFQFKFKQRTNNVYKNFTNYGVRLVIKDVDGDSVIIDSLSNTDVVITKGIDSISILIDKTVINSLVVGNYFYSISLTDEGNITTRYFNGTFGVLDING